MIDKIGLSVRGANITKELMQEFAKNDIASIEITPLKTREDQTDYRLAKRIAEDAGIWVRSFHLPFHPSDLNDPAGLDDEMFRTTIDIQKRMIETAASIGCKIAVIHPSREPYADNERSARIAASQRTLGFLAEFSATMGIQLAVENLPRTCIGRDSSEILELLKADSRLAVCYDTNHLLSESAESFIKACGSKIITIHVSDYDFLDERHWLPGEGKNDWQMIYRLLNDVGYAGPWHYEIGFDGSATISRPRTLTPEDFVRNAKEIFAGQDLTVIGTPAPNLIHWKERMALKEGKK